MKIICFWKHINIYNCQYYSKYKQKHFEQVNRSIITKVVAQFFDTWCFPKTELKKRKLSAYIHFYDLLLFIKY